MPDTWKESAEFKEMLRQTRKTKSMVLRREIEGREDQFEIFSCFSGNYYTHKRKYRIFWIHSTEKRTRDRQARECALKTTEHHLAELNARINKRNLKTYSQIKKKTDEILSSNSTGRFFTIDIGQVSFKTRIQKGRGRPGPGTKYSVKKMNRYTLHWCRNELALKQERNIDGIFPLLCTDDNLSAKEILLAYKYQPRLEKRFSQFKSYLNAAPLLFKKIERVEATMFLYFVALILQAVIERRIRSRMKNEEIKALPIYPEDRPAPHPTAKKIFDLFEGISIYKLFSADRIKGEYRDNLNEIQCKVLSLLGIKEKDYWPSG
jgi:transposase